MGLVLWSSPLGDNQLSINRTMKTWSQVSNQHNQSNEEHEIMETGENKIVLNAKGMQGSFGNNIQKSTQLRPIYMER